MINRLACVIATMLLSATPTQASDVVAPQNLKQCLAEKKVKMYSAWWCPYCFAQLKQFDPTLTRRDMRDTEAIARSYPFLIECASGYESGKSSPECRKIVPGYPTWVLRDGTQLVGAQTLDVLAHATGCTGRRDAQHETP